VTGVSSVFHMVADSSHVYFGAVNDGLYRFEKSASTPIDGATLPYFYDIPGAGPGAMALDQANVYFTTGYDLFGEGSPSSIVRRAKDGSSQVSLYDSTTMAYGVVSDGTYVYWVEEGTLQQDFTDGAVRRIKIDGSSPVPETYAEKQKRPTAIAIDADWVYWLNGGWTNLPGSVSRVRR
jgi:hypothetical protein